MAWRERAQTVAVVVGLALAVPVGRELYGWYAYTDERAQFRELSRSVRTSGVRVVATQMRLDSMRAAIEAMDRELDVVRERVARLEQNASGNAIPAELYPEYRMRLDEYNARVRERNQWLSRWRAVVQENRAAAERYAAQADSIRGLATVLGEPDYRVPTPVELAAEQGLAPRRGRARAENAERGRDPS